MLLLVEEDIPLSSAHQLISLEEIISYMPGNVYWTDLNGVYQGCNTNVVKALNRNSVSEVIGKKLRDLIDNQENAELMEKTDAAVMLSGHAVVLEEKGLDAEGNWAIYFTKKQPLHDAQGRIVGMLGMSLDITERKRAEEALLKAKEIAEAASRTKTEFLANMSHDVKTPLSGLIAVAELLDQRLQGEDKKLVKDLRHCGKTLMSFFENCIELSKMDMMQLKEVEQPFSMAKIVESIYALFVPSAIARKLIFNTHQDPKLPTVLMGNQINIYRVILNLVGNAIKFTSSGSVTLSIVLDRNIDDENIIVKIIVQDTGMGIPKDKQKIIFEKLQRLTPSYYNNQEGHGIGLYIVDQYVKAMHGSIEVLSDEGVGSTFTVAIPLKVASSDEKNIAVLPELSAKEIPAARVPEQLAPRKEMQNESVLLQNAPRVLLVEDNPLIQTVTKQMLQASHVNVDVASTGQEAIDLFKPEKYSVVYMDIGLPDMDGYEVSQRLRAIEQAVKAPKTPILALTAHATVDVKSFCIGAGMQGVLNKPLLFKQAQQVFERYILNNTAIAIDGLTFLEALQPTVEYRTEHLQIIDLPGSVAIVESEARAKEMLAMVVELLDTTFVPEIQTAYQANDDLELRKALHKFLGSLCYISTPALKQATLDFQVAVQEKLTTREYAFQAFLREIKQFKATYLALRQAGII
ncbi:MAG: ATP-binding protein [Pseudomonadota bacterium]